MLQRLQFALCSEYCGYVLHSLGWALTCPRQRDVITLDQIYSSHKQSQFLNRAGFVCESSKYIHYSQDI